MYHCLLYCSAFDTNLDLIWSNPRWQPWVRKVSHSSENPLSLTAISIEEILIVLYIRTIFSVDNAAHRGTCLCQTRWILQKLVLCSGHEERHAYCMEAAEFALSWTAHQDLTWWKVAGARIVSVPFRTQKKKIRLNILLYHNTPLMVLRLAVARGFVCIKWSMLPRVFSFNLAHPW